MSALDLDAVRKRLSVGLRAALTADCAQVLTADLRAFMAHEAGLRMRELLWASADAGWRELIALLEADGKPEGAAVDYVRALITRLRAAEAALPSTTEIYAIEEARSAIESSCDVYCDEIDAWLSRVGEARALLPAAPEAPHG